MIKIFLFILFLCDISYANLILHQPRGDIQFGNTELISNLGDPLVVDLMLHEKYERQDEIFIMPVDYQGDSELYTLGFFVDWEEINTDLDANWFRSYYIFKSIPEKEYPKIDMIEPRIISVPEPPMIILYLFGIYSLSCCHCRKRLFC